MIKIECNHPHGHDIYELVRIFYPNRDLELVEEGGDILSLLEGKEAITRLTYAGQENRTRLDEVSLFKDLGTWKSKLVKFSLYSLLGKEEAKPWGMLTGMRPGKLARQIGNLGLDPAQALQDYFFVSPSKAGLLGGIVHDQEEIIARHKQGYSLYINVPFCPSICSYCSYSVLPAKAYEDEIPAYIDRLVEEINFIYDIYGPADMVYIGGGTPSAIGTRLLERLVDAVSDQGQPSEFTVEIGREDTIDDGILSMLDGRVDRICINPQSMADETARAIGRLQTRQGIIQAYELARKYSFTINMDTILGLPGEGLAQVEESLDELIGLEPDNITVHSLAMKKGSDLTKRGYESTGSIQAMAQLSQARLQVAGYRPYYLYRQKDILGDLENIGYAREGKICHYNVVSMEETQTIIGAGMGAVSKFIIGGRPKRLANYKSLEEYMGSFDKVLERKDSIKGQLRR